jgi:hypothetical protein
MRAIGKAVLYVFAALLLIAAILLVSNGVIGRMYEKDFMRKREGVERPRAMDLDNIIITSYLVPLYDDEHMEQQMKYMKDADIDLVTHIYFSETFVSSEHTEERYKKAAEVADKYGLKILVRDTRIQSILNRTDEEIKGIVDEYKDLPGVGGYYLYDEPKNANPFARVVRLMRTYDTDAICDVNFMPHFGYPSYEIWEKQLRDYCMLLQDKRDILSFDVYTFGEDPKSNNETDMFNDYEIMRQVGLDYGINTAVYVQALGIPGYYRRPDIDVLRYNMMAALAYGFKQLKFFCWATPPKNEGNASLAIMDYEGNPTDLYEPLCKVNKQIHAIGSHLAKLDALEIYHSGMKQDGVTYKEVPKDLFIQPIGDTYSIISLMEHRDTKRNYMMIVNKDFLRSQTVKFEIDGIDYIKEISKETGKEIKADYKKGMYKRKGILTKTLEPGGAALFVFREGVNVIGTLDEVAEQDDSKTNMLKNAVMSASSSYGEEGYYLVHLVDGQKNATLDNKGYMGIAKESTEQFVLFDFRTQKEFNEIVLHPADGTVFPQRFKILVSDGNDNWVEIANEQVALPVEKELKINIEKTKARYIKFVVPKLIRNKYGWVYRKLSRKPTTLVVGMKVY